MKKINTFIAILLGFSVFSGVNATEIFLFNSEIISTKGPEEPEDTLVFSIPNAFMPNATSNLSLSTFKPGSPTSDKFAEYKMQVYNRWGLLVFESTNPDEGWDGMHKGSLCPIDTYVYIINYAFWAKDNVTGEPIAGEKMKTKGTVTLLD